MDLDKANELVTGPGPDANPKWDDLRAELAAKHSDHPQRAQLADMALRTIETGIAELAKLGHMFHLTPGQAGQPSKFPLMVYRNGPQGLEHRTVDSESALEEARPDGWTEDQSQAQAEPARAPERLSGAEPGPETVGEEASELVARPEPQPASPPPSALGEENPPVLSGETDAKLPEEVSEEKTLPAGTGSAGLSGASESSEPSGPTAVIKKKDSK